MKYLRNLYSTYLARRFSKQWFSDDLRTALSSHKTLQKYKKVRRSLPLMDDGNHWGNHNESKRNPYKATQGF